MLSALCVQWQITHDKSPLGVNNLCAASRYWKMRQHMCAYFRTSLI
jgi:hypothetical protein